MLIRDAEPSLVAEHFRRAILPLLERWNAEPCPRVPRGYGMKVCIPGIHPRGEVTSTLLPVKVVGGGVTVGDELRAFSYEPWRPILVALEHAIREAEDKWGYAHNPRAWYDTSSTQVSLYQDPRDMTTIVAWKLYMLIKPKRWRSRMWRRRQLEARRGQAHHG